ncbi:MAG: IPT/TIG domain-containing protein [Planctomycetes bacterium]|nr:IPT/TIG domain-containing protein [Planctomycetota bacterium]
MKPGILGFLMALGFFAASGCDDRVRVRETFPPSGAEDVDPKTGIAIRLSNTFSKTDPTDGQTLGQFIAVTGDRTAAPYAGTVAVKKFSEVFPSASGSAAASGSKPASSGALTDTLRGASSTTGSTSSSTTGTTESSGAGTSNTAGQANTTGLGGARSTSSTANLFDTGEDTLVFTLAQGTEFKIGERITVRVSKDLKVRGNRIDPFQFSFRVRLTDPSQAAGGDLRVESTSPASYRLGADPRPVITARFSKAVKPDRLAENLTLRGEHSGVHAVGEVLYTKKQAEGKILEIAARLLEDDAFQPGEQVTATLSDEILGADAATTGGAAAGAGTVRLSPYSFSFQVVAGKVTQGWLSQGPVKAGPEARRLAAGNLRPADDGIEFVALSIDKDRAKEKDKDRLEIFYQESPGQWNSFRLDHFDAGFHPVDVAVGDMDRDGAAEVALLLEGPDSSKVTLNTVGSTGALIEKEELNFPATRLQGFFLADLDSNGFLDLLIQHENTTYTPTPAQGEASSAPKETGTITVFEKSTGAIDPTQIDPSNLGALLGNPAFHRVENPIPELKHPGRIAAGDLDGDGKPDLVVEADEGLILYRNAGTRTNRIVFVFARQLKDANRQPFTPPSWGLADLDGDKDVDLLAFDERGAWLFTNKVFPKPARAADPAASRPRGFLFEEIPPQHLPLPAPVRAPIAPWFGDMNGDQALDLLLVEPSGGLHLFTGKAGKALEFEAYPPAGSGLPPLAASVSGDLADRLVVDADGDTGLDLVILARTPGDAANLEILRAAGVVGPSLENPHRFYIDVDESRGRTNSLENKAEVAVVVKGNMGADFKGYQVTLDFDERWLEFSRFQEPPDFRGVGAFTACPDAQKKGCAGFASASMSLKNSLGSKGDGQELGTFIFLRRAVQSQVQTGISLAEGFKDNMGNEIGNFLTVPEGDAQLSLRADIEKEAFPVTVSPPPPPPPANLVITECQVLEMRDVDFQAAVGWESPAGKQYASFVIEIAGNHLATLAGAARRHEFSWTGTGAQNVKVIGRADTLEVIASAECQLLPGIYKPIVTCEHDSVGKRNLLSWSILGQVDWFRVYKNGSSQALATLPGNVFSAIDRNPTGTGGDSYEVAGMVGIRLGPKGQCQDGPVGDPTPTRTDPPQSLAIELQNRTAVDSPNVLKFRWTNSEGYDQILFKLFIEGQAQPVVSETLSGSVSEHAAAGDPQRGGVAPQIYRFSLQAVRIDPRTKEEYRSAEVKSAALPVPLPPLGAALSCTRVLGDSVRLSWTRPWQGYTSIEAQASQKLADPPSGSVTAGNVTTVFVSTSSTEYTFEKLPPGGEYTFTVKALHESGLPASLLPPPPSLVRSCTLEFQPAMRLGTVETGVGLRNVLLPIQADVLGKLTGFSCTVEVPEVLRLDYDPAHPEKLVRLNSKDAKVEVLPPAAGDAPGTRQITFSASGGEFQPGENKVLAWIIGEVDKNFELAGAYSLRFLGQAFHTYEGASPVAVQAKDQDAQLLVRKRFVVVEWASAVAGSTRPVVIRVLGTFDKPKEDPNYRLLAFSIHLKFDPTLLDLQPITKTDQLETVVGTGGGFLFPTGAKFDEARQTGDLEIPWLWIDLLGSNPITYIYPGYNMPLLVVKFLPKVPANPAGDLALLHLVRPPEPRPTIFEPEKVARGGSLEAYFDGAIDILPRSDVPTLIGMDPARGSLVGGGEAMAFGFNLLKGVIDPKDLKLSLVYRPEERRAAVTQILEPGQNLIRFTIPEAGAYFYKPGFASVPMDLELETPNGRSILTGAYAYENLDLVAADLASGSEQGGERMVISGFGFPARLEGNEVRFRIQGEAGEAGDPGLQAEVVEAAANGRRLTIRTPPMNGFAGKLATVQVAVPQLGSDGLPFPFRIEASDVPRIVSIAPNQGFQGGGTAVEIAVQGFGDLTGRTLKVMFGSASATGVALQSANVLRAITPASPAAGPVDVTVQAGTAQAFGAGLFTYLVPQIGAITDVNPKFGSICGGTRLVIQGSGFKPELELRFNGTAIAFQYIDAGRIEMDTPAVPEGTREAAIAISVDGGPFVEWGQKFQYQDGRPAFVRGDVSQNGAVDISDAVALGEYLTAASAGIPNIDAIDVNDDGLINTGDFVVLTGFLYQGKGSIPPPYPQAGMDPTPDGLTGCR